MRNGTVGALRRLRQERTIAIMHNFLALMQVLLSLALAPGHVSASLHRQRCLMHDLMSQMTQEQWLQSFCMELQEVQDLFAKIADALYHYPVLASNSSG